MATQITNYQCPACTGPLRYDGATGKLTCDYCGSVYSVQEIEALYADKLDAAEAAGVQAQTAPASESDGSDGDAWAEGLRAYNCPSCGAELLCDATTAATSCPYCGNPTVVPAQFHGKLKPDYVLPFKLDKEAAVEALKRYYKGKRLLPKAFSEHNHIEEIKGVYVPFWLYSGRVNVDLHFNATRSHSHRSGQYEITETDHFRVRRAGTVNFERVPADGSSKMPDAHMDAIEPFDYGDLKPFSTAYLPGFLADVYDVSAKEASERAVKRAVNSAEAAFTATATGYSTCTVTDRQLSVSKLKTHYALLPVWLLSTRWNDRSFLFAMNGQTGKLIGDLPVSKERYFAWFFGIAAPIAAVLAALLFLL